MADLQQRIRDISSAPNQSESVRSAAHALLKRFSAQQSTPPSLPAWALDVDKIVYARFPNGDRTSLGRGSFGIVYQGTLNDAAVAVKELDGRLMSVPGSLDLFREEMDMLFSVSHPNIVRMYGASVAFHPRQGVLPCIVMELLPIEMTDLIHHPDTIESTAAVTIPRKLRILRQIASVLCYLHGRRPQILHRDLKPSNVMLTAELEPKLIDFGLARAKENSRAVTDSTAGKGTARYTVCDASVISCGWVS